MADANPEVIPLHILDSDDAPTDQPRRRGRPPGSRNVSRESVSTWGPEDLAVMQGALMVLILGLTTVIAKRTGQDDLTATKEEAENISKPLSRMAARHLKVKRQRQGDVADVLALSTALIAYSSRVVRPRFQKPQGDTQPPQIFPLYQTGTSAS